MNKYHNTETIRKGAWFQSKKEAARWDQLQLMARAGMIQELQRQVWFTLIPAQRRNGKLVERMCRYRADFTYIENGELVVEDSKGQRTPDYIIKRKLMLQVHNIQVRET